VGIGIKEGEESAGTKVSGASEMRMKFKGYEEVWWLRKPLTWGMRRID